MKGNITQRESERVADLAREYRKKGYSVIIPSLKHELPKFLADSGYVPDLVVKTPKNNMVIEVKSRQTVAELKSLSGIADLINSQRGWEFVLVVTNPREPTLISGWASAEDARFSLQKSESFNLKEQPHIEAAFLFSWAALEQVLRAALTVGLTKELPKNTKSLVRDAATKGIIGRRDAHFLDRLLETRNWIVHGNHYERLTSEDVLRLRKIVQSVARTELNMDV